MGWFKLKAKSWGAKRLVLERGELGKRKNPGEEEEAIRKNRI